MPVVPMIIGISLLVLLGIGLAIAWRSEMQRKPGMASAAEQLGFTYREDGEDLRQTLEDALPTFQRGRRRRIANVVAGSIEDLEVMVFDHKYTTGSGKNSSTRRRTLVAFRTVGAPRPAFHVEPEYFYHRIAEKLGLGQDIDFDEFPDFSKQYRLSGDEEAAVRSYFDEPLVRAFESREGITVTANEEWIVVCRKGRGREKVVDVPGLLEEAFTICNEIARPA